MHITRVIWTLHSDVSKFVATVSTRMITQPVTLASSNFSAHPELWRLLRSKFHSWSSDLLSLFAMSLRFHQLLWLRFLLQQDNSLRSSLLLLSATYSSWKVPDGGTRVCDNLNLNVF